MARDFFTKSTGEAIEPTTEYVGGGFQSLIPEGTQLHVAIAGATWEEATAYKNKRVEVLLHVVEKGQYKDFIVKDTIKLFDDKASISDKAQEKLMTYDTLCKGVILKTARAGKDIEDDNGLLARALNGGELMATFSIWKMENGKWDGVNPDDEFVTGNWVKSIGPLAKKIQDENKHIEKKAKEQPNATVAPLPIDGFDDYDSEIPF